MKARVTRVVGQNPGHHRSAATGFNATDFTPKNTRKLGVTAVKCPVEACSAEPGQPCLNAEGTEMATYVHPPRKRMATRAALQRVDSPAIEYATGLTAAERKAIRTAVGISQEALAHYLGVDIQTLRFMERGESEPARTLHAAYGAWLALRASHVPGTKVRL